MASQVTGSVNSDYKQNGHRKEHLASKRFGFVNIIFVFKEHESLYQNKNNFHFFDLIQDLVQTTHPISTEFPLAAAMK